jgi:hypothetical protein
VHEEITHLGFGCPADQINLQDMFADTVNLVSCGGGNLIAGNRQGRLRTLAPVKSIAGQMVTLDQSQTSLKHQVTIDGNTKNVCIDSAMIPTAASSLSLTIIGRLVRSQNPSSGHSLVTIAGDQGPAFGDGSNAMHQMLAVGKLTNQLAGPIPVSERGKTSVSAPPTPVIHAVELRKISGTRTGGAGQRNWSQSHG